MTASRSRTERSIAWEKLLDGDERWEWDIRPWLECCLNAQAEFATIASGQRHDPVEDVADWPVLSVFRDLTYYGLYGDLFDRSGISAPESHLDDQIALGTTIHTKAPFRYDDRIVSKVIAVAEARRNIERARGGVEPLALAVLGGVSEGRIRNLMSGANAELDSVDGRIPAAEAERWLQGRGPFWPSIWNDELETEKESILDNIEYPSHRTALFFIRASGGEVAT